MKQDFVNNDFADILLNRHSIRHFDPKVNIDRQTMTDMISATITAPSACNLQAWKFIVVDTEAGKDKLRQCFMKFNSPQLETCAAMVVIFADALAFHSYRDLWDQAYQAGRITAEKRDEVLATFLPLYERAPKEMLIVDAQRDASLAAMQLMLIARAYGYDSNPIAGYDGKQLTQLLDLDPERYTPCMALAIGKADPDHAEEEVKSIRYALEDVLSFVD
ncbi:hypothetical protein SAMN04488558_10770 [Ignavigranum ruoffiae]|uniref:Nitroreductase domain-containing protein n=1 Tax=Ignavigranum ruoffiae TaxID=89093 RepID=A0A1H9ELE8_9LACT|nr:nitroreductase family protein [Ignavigranum ruoffiae]SEQ26412.1 hypothetical protein SAMN04488558_10770 [Ignavigranum ruoffiae]